MQLHKTTKSPNRQAVSITIPKHDFSWWEDTSNDLNLESDDSDDPCSDEGEPREVILRGKLSMKFNFWMSPYLLKWWWRNAPKRIGKRLKERNLGYSGITKPSQRGARGCKLFKATCLWLSITVGMGLKHPKGLLNARLCCKKGRKTCQTVRFASGLTKLTKNHWEVASHKILFLPWRPSHPSRAPFVFAIG
jgi:hypothetical protein